MTRRMMWAALVVGLAWTAAGQDAFFTQTRNVVYGEAHGVGLVMDVFAPNGVAPPAMFNPSSAGEGLAIIDVASGAWSSDRGKIEDHYGFKMYHIFCARGYTVFAVRPGSKSRFTGLDMLAHMHRAIRYIKAHADDYGIDPDRIGMTGASAGGHLACLAMTRPDGAHPDSDDPLKRFDTRVKAVGVFFPPTDLVNWGGKEPPYQQAAGLLFLGGLKGHSREEIAARAKELSPVNYAGPVMPPFLVYHGDADPVVPLQQSEDLVDALKAAGNEAELIVKPGGTHPWITLTLDIVTLADWFDAQLAD